ncbi:hypothetical protein SNEBB_003923 [Seison nebaliae]|nr:hypothetical protein SNEBB_003923 [Seison nebaliae]
MASLDRPSVADQSSYTIKDTSNNPINFDDGSYEGNRNICSEPMELNFEFDYGTTIHGQPIYQMKVDELREIFQEWDLKYENNSKREITNKILRFISESYPKRMLPSWISHPELKLNMRLKEIKLKIHEEVEKFIVTEVTKKEILDKSVIIDKKTKEVQRWNQILKLKLSRKWRARLETRKEINEKEYNYYDIIKMVTEWRNGKSIEKMFAHTQKRKDESAAEFYRRQEIKSLYFPEK